MVFTGKLEIPKGWINEVIANNSDILVKFYKRPHTETEPNLSLLQKHKLGLDSQPVHWFEAFLPISNIKQRNEFTKENCLSFTNARDMMEKENPGGKYGGFTNFTLNELMKHTGIHLF